MKPTTKWEHYEAEDGIDEFWAKEVKIHKTWHIEVHIGRDLKTKKYDFQLLDQGQEFVYRTGFATRKSAEQAMYTALCMILKNAAEMLKWEIK